MRKRTWYRVYCGIFLLLLVGTAFFGAYSGGRDSKNPADFGSPSLEATSVNPWKTFWLDPSAVFTGIVAIFTVALAVSTIGLWIVTGKAATAAQVSAQAANQSAAATSESNALARQNFVADQRPWISVRCALIQPITWGVNGCNLHFRFVLENTGRTPALHAFIHLRAYSQRDFDPPREQTKLADTARAGKSLDWGTTVFPGEKAVLDVSTNIGNEELAEVRAWWKKRAGKDMDWIHPTLVGCVDYRSVFGGASHQTGFIYEIRRHVAVNNSVAIGPSVGDIPLDHLELSHWFQSARID